MNYVYLLNDTVYEIIPEFNPVFPSIPIEQRYSAEFLKNCIAVPDDVEVAQGWLYDTETGKFIPPAQPEPEPELEQSEQPDVVSTED